MALPIFIAPQLMQYSMQGFQMWHENRNFCWTRVDLIKGQDTKRCLPSMISLIYFDALSCVEVEHVWLLAKQLNEPMRKKSDGLNWN
jgi:hypothetical protein